jgi:gamma-glutamyltranspeptidase/glutathione hydrolase
MLVLMTLQIYENSLHHQENLLFSFNKLHDAFYKGDIANTIIKHSNNRNGLLTKDDLGNYDVGFEKTVFEKFGDYSIHKTDIWGQG